MCHFVSQKCAASLPVSTIDVMMKHIDAHGKKQRLEGLVITTTDAVVATEEERASKKRCTDNR
ncbi:hypothetical protein CCR75_008698 [Bremia lactucae]|uniref:Uncharacterized protein n=1 Tax=Bremia lactucae TaxID=4779 RepID=A0A976IF73_BRELC|nr:hypothetical protein CCR75_008698 [Bremia lactucae]